MHVGVLLLKGKITKEQKKEQNEEPRNRLTCDQLKSNKLINWSIHKLTACKT